MDEFAEERINITMTEFLILLGYSKMPIPGSGIAIYEFLRSNNIKISYGSLYQTLKRLYEMGLLSRQDSVPLPVRGGRRQIIYTLTTAGEMRIKRIASDIKNLYP